MVDVAGRRVHYRMCGSGPPVLIIRQSLHSSAENAALMQAWGRRFTCIAPDTPGFGQSDPLPLDGVPAEAAIDHFADALAGFLDALGIQRIGAYGYHSGGVILMAALNRHPQRFTAAAVGAYALWEPHETTRFTDAYLPAFEPAPYGEHLTWLWNRLLEHTWFFPWYDPRNDNRQPGASADLPRIANLVDAILDSGEAYRMAYGAALHSPSRIPPPYAASAPTLIVASDPDMLQSHLARLPPLPAGWEARAVRTPQDAVDASFNFLAAHPAPSLQALPACPDEGFLPVAIEGFEGLIHWRGDRAAPRVLLHAPGASVELLDAPGDLLIDLPGHGLSDAFLDDALCAWARLVATAVRTLARGAVRTVAGQGASALLALAVAAELGVEAEGREAHIPQPQDAAAWLDRWPASGPDRFGHWLAEAWQVARASHFWWPWFSTGAAFATPFAAADIAPSRLALEHRSLIRARAGKRLMQALLTADRDALLKGAKIVRWQLADWARPRPDVWRP